MKKNFLLPHCYLKIGLLLIIPFLIMCVLELAEVAPTWEISVPYVYSDWLTERTWFGISDGEDIYGEIWMIGIFVSLVFIAFSKEKVEDEMIVHLRLQTMLFAFWCTSILFVLAIMFVFGIGYLYCIWAAFPLFLIIFTIKFRYELYKLSREDK